MTEVGLLIGFGVLIGSLLHSLGTFRKLVGGLLRAVGAKRLPYAMTAALSTVFPSIYVDVQVVLASPIARTSAPHIGPRGLAHMAGAIGIGIFAGYVFVIPGLAAVSIAGLLSIPLGTWLLYGILLGPVTAVVTSIVFGLMVRTRYWNPAKDEDPDEGLDVSDEADAVGTGVVGTGPGEKHSKVDVNLPLAMSLLPIIVPLLLIAFGAFAELLGFSNPAIAFFGDANIALFVGLLGAYVLARATSGQERTQEALSTGFHTTGEILLITGIGGSLGAVIEATGMDKTLAGLFSAEGAAVVTSILLAWFIAAVLHLAIGSVSVAAITAAGDHCPSRGFDRGRPYRDRTGDRLRRHVRAASQQQLLLDVPFADGTDDPGRPQVHDDGDQHRVGGLAPGGPGDRPAGLTVSPADCQSSRSSSE